MPRTVTMLASDNMTPFEAVVPDDFVLPSDPPPAPPSGGSDDPPPISIASGEPPAPAPADEFVSIAEFEATPVATDDFVYPDYVSIDATDQAAPAVRLAASGGLATDWSLDDVLAWSASRKASMPTFEDYADWQGDASVRDGGDWSSGFNSGFLDDWFVI